MEGRKVSLQDLTPEQVKKLQNAFQKHIEEEAKKSVAQLDKTLDSVVALKSYKLYSNPLEH